MLRKLGNNIDDINIPQIKSVVYNYSNNSTYFKTLDLTSSNTTSGILSKKSKSYYRAEIPLPCHPGNILKISVILEDIIDNFFWSKHDVIPVAMNGITDENWVWRRANAGIETTTYSSGTITTINGFLLRSDLTTSMLYVCIERPYVMSYYTNTFIDKSYHLTQIRAIKIEYVDNHPKIYNYF